MPQTFSGVVLLGWMDRDSAVKYLTKNCISDPPYTETSAEALWRQYRDKCEALLEREALAPEQLPLNHDEQRHTAQFLASLNQIGPHTIQGFVKVDLSKLVAHQLAIAVNRANEQYLNRVRSTAGWLHQALPLGARPAAQITSRVSVNGLHTSADFDIPHSEFIFGPDPTGQFFSVQQLQSYISVMRGPGNNGGRLLLKAGYHRSYARARSMMPPAATVPSAVVALERNTFGDTSNQVAGAGLIVDTAGLCPTGRRPALLADFFDEDLAMKVNLRRKRYQLQVRSTWVEIDV